MDAAGIAEAFQAAARLAVETSDADRAAARRSADRYARDTQLKPAVRDVTELVRSGGATASRQAAREGQR
jgi:hypothetical protein